jgi:hypothetical protein
MASGTTSSDYIRGLEKATLSAFQALPQPAGPCKPPAVVYPTTPGEKDYLITKVTACPLYFAPENTAGTCSSGSTRGTLLLQRNLYPRIKGIEDIAVPAVSNPASLFTSRLTTSVIESNLGPNTGFSSIFEPSLRSSSVGTFVVQSRFSEFFPPNIPYPCKKRLPG